MVGFAASPTMTSADLYGGGPRGAATVNGTVSMAAPGVPATQAASGGGRPVSTGTGAAISWLGLVLALVLLRVIYEAA